MKANKFVMENDDEAVSPVIAVILMVAITVVLAATVYVWVSGFGTSGSIKKFPQVTMRDDPTDDVGATGADDQALIVLEHRGGDTIPWTDYTLNVFRNGGSAVVTGTSSVDYATAQACTTTTATPAGSFSVGGKIYICTNDAAPAWVDGDRLKLQIIDDNSQSIVYENEVVVS